MDESQALINLLALPLGMGIIAFARPIATANARMSSTSGEPRAGIVALLRILGACALLIGLASVPAAIRAVTG